MLDSQLPELLALRQGVAEDSDDAEEVYAEAQQRIRRKYHAVTVEFASEEQLLSGTTRITREIFNGGDKAENALLFLENLDKVKTQHAIESYERGLDPETSTLRTAEASSVSEPAAAQGAPGAGQACGSYLSESSLGGGSCFA